MLFNSLSFAIFFPIVFTLHFVLPHRQRWWLLLIASYVFYMWWRPEYALLILFSTGVDFFAARAMHRSLLNRTRKLWLAFSLTCNLGTLVAFKYLGFFTRNVNRLASELGWERLGMLLPEPDWLLPVGISFYTFQSLSYTIDVYRGDTEPEEHFGYFALYVSFFPQLVAGPIERSSRLLPQIRERRPFDYRLAADGLKVMLWGLFKKIVIADRLAPLVDTVYSEPTQFVGLSLILATIAFSLQIYCDFSGYSDIAIGSARMMGFELMRNFRRPYAAQSIGEFWRRWHISLSTWFRDYLYIPLGGSRASLGRHCFNLLVVFVVSGLWHGARWTFVTWGAIHGSMMVIEAIFRGPARALASRLNYSSWPTIVRRAISAVRLLSTLSIVCAAWVFFRAESIDDALYICTHFHVSLDQALSISGVREAIRPIGFARTEYVIVITAILLMEIVQSAEEGGRLAPRIAQLPAAVRWTAYSALFWIVVWFGVYGNEQQFIYFVF